MTKACTVIIPSFNRSRPLFRALKSLTTQVFTNFSVIVVDDGSTDDTANVCEYYRSYLYLLYIYQTNSGGPASPRNVGLAHSSTKYIAFLDSDYWWHKDKLYLSIQALESGEDLVYHVLLIYTENQLLPTQFRRIRTHKFSGPVFNDLITYGNSIPNSFVVVRCRILDLAGPFSEDFSLVSSGDYDMWLRVSLHTDRFYRIKPLGYYSLSSDNLTSPIKTINSAHYLLDKYGYNFNKTPFHFSYSLCVSYFRLSNFNLAIYYALVSLRSFSWPSLVPLLFILATSYIARLSNLGI